MTSELYSDEYSGDDIPIDPGVTGELFAEWRSPRLGAANPERMNNAVWEWLVKSRVSAFWITQQLGGPSAFDAGPGWCCRRFGQSTTLLEDGRQVLIAGEHEDHYDPDFYIYNDVVVKHPDGRIDIFGYPREIFPPTDFHSATLVNNRIVVIGNLGYPANRQPTITDVFILDLESFSISRVQTFGRAPGWLYRHTATLSAAGDSITVQYGMLSPEDDSYTEVENIDDWELDFKDWTWKRLTERMWPRFEVRREDRRFLHLWHIGSAQSSLNMGWKEEAQEALAKLTEELGTVPDLAAFNSLFCPSVAHDVLADTEDDFRVHRITVSGVVIRYVEDSFGVRVTVEGNLPLSVIEGVTHELQQNLTSLENSPCELKRCSSP